MCTVSWTRTPEGYELFCNRDERHTRRPSAPPVVRERRGVRFAAPIDGDCGGSWIGVNEKGLALCLLNRYEDARGTDEVDYRSRGLLLTDLLHCRTISALSARLLSADLSRYRPFTLAALSTREATSIFHWANRRKTFDDDAEGSMPLTSSSFRSDDVTNARRQLFRRMVDEAGAVNTTLLREFHKSHAPERGAFSVCMHRADAATVSFSHVSVNERSVEFSYQPLSPCVQQRAVKVELPLALVVFRSQR
jgi:uncharacterized protein with NRDE domain